MVFIVVFKPAAKWRSERRAQRIRSPHGQLQTSLQTRVQQLLANDCDAGHENSLELPTLRPAVTTVASDVPVESSSGKIPHTTPRTGCDVAKNATYAATKPLLGDALPLDNRFASAVLSVTLSVSATLSLRPVLGATREQAMAELAGKQWLTSW